MALYLNMMAIRSLQVDPTGSLESVIYLWEAYLIADYTE